MGLLRMASLAWPLLLLLAGCGDSDADEIYETGPGCLGEQRCIEETVLSECFESTPDVATCDEYCAAQDGASCVEECQDGTGLSYGPAGKGKCEYERMDFATEFGCSGEPIEGSWMRCCCG